MAANIPPRQHNVRAHSSPVDVSPTIAGSKGVPTLDPAPVSTSPGPASQRKHIVLPDPVAFKYLQEDPLVKVIESRQILRGYELYLIEQWACSRQSPTLVIATFTGDSKDAMVVGVLSVPADERAWSPRLRVFFKAVQQYHARPKDTAVGEMMVTNLSSFPSAFTAIPVPDGDIRKHQKIFIVNEDLKRLGCSGRSGLTLSEPTAATQAKFHQLYRVSDRVPFFQSVLELVKLCQVALFIFGQLDQEYIDGLLCDVTETAISNWWIELGAEYYNMEPSDGILGPTTVAALLGMLMGARNRLHSYGAPVSKDVFDIEATKRGIAYFQKYQKLDKSRRLDRQTLLKLQSVTAKAAASDGWGVQRAVKSTVAEIGGKRGELVMDMVSGRDKAGIGEIETLEIDRFIALAYGERAKWLWHGKPRRSAADHQDRQPHLSGAMLGRDPLVHLEEEVEARRKADTSEICSTPPPGSAASMAEGSGDKDAGRKTVFKSVAGKMSDARTGLGRIKDAVGGSRRAPRPAKDEYPDSGLSSPSRTGAMTQSPGVSSPPVTGRAFTWKNKPEEYRDAFKPGEEPETSQASLDSMNPASRPQGDLTNQFNSIATEVRRDVVVSPPSRPDSIGGDGNLLGPLLALERRLQAPLHHLHHLHRRHSLDVSRLSLSQSIKEARWPRRLSFGDAEEAVLQWDEVTDVVGGHEGNSSPGQQRHLAEVVRTMNDTVLSIKEDLEPWVLSKIEAIEALDDRYGKDQEDIQALSYQLTEAYQEVKATSLELIGEERGHLAENIKDVEVFLARLDYEISTLVSKVEDVEEGVAVFEKQVRNLERKAEELKAQLETESWLHWFVRTLTGIGTGPNITRPREAEDVKK